MSFFRIRICWLRNIACTCIFFIIYFFTSCENADIKKDVRPYENKLGIKPANLARIDTINYTTIEWIEPHKQLGTVVHGDSVILKYRFKNTGVHPLFIYAAHPSCGCTLPQLLPEEAIMPGNEDELTVIFNSNGQQGQVYKTIMVTSNTSNGVKHLLSFKGLVNTWKKK